MKGLVMHAGFLVEGVHQMFEGSVFRGSGQNFTKFFSHNLLEILKMRSIFHDFLDLAVGIKEIWVALIEIGELMILKAKAHYDDHLNISQHIMVEKIL